MMSVARWVALLCWSLAGLLPAAALDWEIERSFRFFRYPSDVAVQRVAYDLLRQEHGAAPSVEEVERRLNGGGFWASRLPEAGARPRDWPAAWRDPAIATMRDLATRLRNEERARSRLPPASELDRLGWASLLANPAVDRTDTCWDPATRLHTGCQEHSDDYVRPAGWIVRVHDPDAAPGETCDWSGAAPAAEPRLGTKPKGPAASFKADCREVRLYVPADATGDAAAGTATILRSRPGGVPDQIVVAPKDRLIVGFGDSFTSGEGNPERPATFSQIFWSAPLYLPRRATGGVESAAHWTDRWCHRSVYSWQVRTAVALAMADRKTSVTLLPYGCSGAEITTGLVYGYNGVEYGEPARPVQGHPAQLGLAYQELCRHYVRPSAFPTVPGREQDGALRSDAVGDADRIVRDATAYVARCSGRGPDVFKRRVDLVLLGIGVNDVGFSRWVAGALLTGLSRAAARGFLPAGPEGGACGDEACRLTARLTDRLRGRYRALRRILDERFLPTAQVPADRVLVELYPTASQRAEGQTCAPGSGGMTGFTFNRLLGDGAARRCEGDIDIFGGRGAVMAVRAPADLLTIEDFRDRVLNGRVRDFAAAYSLVDGYLPRFVGRGFCATTDVESAPTTPACRTVGELLSVAPISCGTDQPDCRRRMAESLHIPRRTQETWRPTAPGMAGPYWPRRRLIRTPNDVFTLINKRPANVLDTTPIGPLDLKDRASSGAFHPSAEGHGLVADAVLQRVRQVAPP